MKKVLVLLVAAMLAVTGAAATGCGGEKDILVVMREAGSGTREAFEKVVAKDGVTLEDISKDKTDKYSFVTKREESSSTAGVITLVSSNKNAIGYVSLSSVGEDVKALTVEGVKPTTETVQDGDYKIQRPFLLLTRAGGTITPAAQDFYNFCMSATALEYIDSEGLIEYPDRTPGTYEAAEFDTKQTINISGSTSMREIMTKLVGAYGKVQPNVEVKEAYPGSSGGRTAVKDDTTGNTIGLASASSPSENYKENTLCLDAVAVVVNPANKLEDISILQLFDIYTGAVKKFSEIDG